MRSAALKRNHQGLSPLGVGEVQNRGALGRSGVDVHLGPPGQARRHRVSYDNGGACV